ncbi:hypothetical protein E5F31_06290 [Clostridioides difficile]|uniref:hypothetical protein n=1 Tax=Clostridioides difficile TaxID=1496 RepID=UPI00107EB05B|nr:hypothetical protein [Clostridioides difficile]TGA61449.1 hypothetical protein E5F31_06290 [Clostridioides difficile]
MKTKTITIRVEESLIDKLNYYKELDPDGNMSQSEFMCRAIEEKCERIRKQRSGSFELLIPNPQNVYSTDDEKKTIVLKLAECANEINKTNVSLDFGIDYLVGYAKQRLITDTKELRKKFETNFKKDLEFETSLELDLESKTEEELEKMFEEYKNDIFSSEIISMIKDELLRRDDVRAAIAETKKLNK